MIGIGYDDLTHARIAATAILQTCLLPDYWTKDDDGLAQEWHGRVYMNPPMDEIAAWVERMVRAYENSEIAEAIVLLLRAPTPPGIRR